MLTKDDLRQIGEVTREVLREDVLPRLDTLETRTARTEQKVDEISRGLASVEFRLADVQDHVDVIARSVDRIERRLDAANISEPRDDDDGPWLPPFRPSGT